MRVPQPAHARDSLDRREGSYSTEEWRQACPVWVREKDEEARVAWVAHLELPTRALPPAPAQGPSEWG